MSNAPSQAAPLAGITVIEVANYGAGPSVGALMADLGAGVIKVEPPGGEVMRGVLPGPLNYLFELENRGKRSITVALDRPGGPELMLGLLVHADIMLTNLIAPRLRKYHLMPEDVHRQNPRLIHVSVTGYGIHGPEADRPAFDYAGFWARSGIMSLMGHPAAPPVISRIAQGDHTTGINALAATLAALRVRDATGEGQVVEVALQQTGVYTIATDVARVLVEGKQPTRFDRTSPPNPLFNTYQTAGGRWLMLVHMTPDPYWPRLCRAINRPDLANDLALATMAGRSARAPELFRAIQDAFGRHDAGHWARKLDEEGLIWAPMVELPEVVRDEQLRVMGAFQAIDDHPEGRFETVATPFHIRDADIRVRGRAPEAGEHTFEVLTGFGWSEEAIAGLAARGLLG